MILSMLALLVGCAPSTDLEDTADTSTEADADTDADTDTDTDTDADSDADSDSDADADPQSTALAATTNYSVGALTTFDLDSRAATDVADIASDSALIVEGDYAIQLGRLGFDYVRLYTLGDWSNPLEFSLAEGSNPQDAHFCADNLFISQYGLDKIAIYSSTGNPVGSIDLSSYSDADGSPEAAGIVKDGDRLFVALQIMNSEDFSSAGPGQIIEIDCAAQSITNEWEVGVNPRIQGHPDDGELLFVRTGLFGSPDGAVHILNVADGSLEEVVKESDVGGDIAGLVLASSGRALLHVYTPSYASQLYCVDADGAGMTQLGGDLPYSNGPWINDQDEAWIGVSDDWQTEEADGGVMIIDVDACQDLTSDGLVTSTLGVSSVSFY
ncbi:MAG: hypothetical protein ACI9VR_000580 [Cognaticolwellia sp.]|jgi:hypothetical protein